MAEKEYIERDAVLTLLEDDREVCADSKEELKYIRADIRSIPAADVRPVVLCRDCKWTKTDGVEDPAVYCKKWDRWEMPPDGFCWLGKKKEES